MSYKYIIFDVDDTLLNYGSAFYTAEKMECDPEECLMVGDSMSNDMVGALDAGMDVCYYNNRNKRIPEGISVNYEIKGIEELLNILA